MKRIITLFVVLIFAYSAGAQDKSGTTSPPPAAKKMAEKKYWCTQCDYSSSTAGVCPHHKTALVKEGMYFCKGDETNASATMGKCKDGTAMVKMDESLIKKNHDAMKKTMEKPAMDQKK